MKAIELRHLRCLVTIADEGSFGRAAARLGMSQPAVSQLLRRLEDVLGQPLIDRASQPVALTPVGAIVLPAVRRCLHAVDDALGLARRAARGETGRLRIGFSAPSLYNDVPVMIRRFRAASPDVTVEMIAVPSQDQAAALLDRRIDLGFGSTPAEDASLARILVGEEGMLAALPVWHPLAGAGPLRLVDLAGEDWILPPRGTHARDSLILHCAALGFTPRIAGENGDFTAVLALVRTGAGIALAAARFRDFTGPDLVLRAIEDFQPRLCTYLAWRRDENDPIVERFLATAGKAERNS